MSDTLADIFESYACDHYDEFSNVCRACLKAIQARLAALEADLARLQPALEQLADDFASVLGDGLTDENQPATLRNARAALAPQMLMQGIGEITGGLAHRKVQAQGWIVVAGSGSFSTCYGIFESYDAAVNWLRGNGWTPADCEVRPIQRALETFTEAT